MRCLRLPLTAALAASLLWLTASLAQAAPRAYAPVQERPVDNVGYVTSQLVYMANHYLMRYSGFDGPPGDLKAADGNRPPTVNGWQEFFQHWQQQMTSPKVMGREFAPAVNIADHLFKVSEFGASDAPYPGDVKVATIPGQACPGQVALVAGHPDSTPLLNAGNGSAYDDTSGVTMGMGELQALTHWWHANHAWPDRTIKVALFDAEEVGLEGSQYYASHLIPPGPQGKYVLVTNMDQNGMEYPAYPEGTRSSTWTPGPWYTNINASPIHDFSIYGPNAHTPPPAIAHNLPAIRRFRAALAQAVQEAFSVLGHRYHFSIRLNNPSEHGKVVPAYRKSDIARYSPVQDDTLGRTDQVPFVALGIPGYGVLGAFDSNSKEDIVGNTPLSPFGSQGLILQQAGYDTPRDNIAHLNFMTNGTLVDDKATEGLRRALELPSTWSIYLLARPQYAGAVRRSAGPIAYYEALPTKVRSGKFVSFDASGSVSRGGGRLSYYWDFGDGSHATGERVRHSYAHDGWYDAVLTVVDSRGHVRGYRTGIRVGKATRRPATSSCGLVDHATETRVIRENRGHR